MSALLDWISEYTCEMSLENVIKTKKIIKEYLEEVIRELGGSNIKRCEFLYADWCHCDKRMPQELCAFYYHNEECPDYKKLEAIE